MKSFIWILLCLACSCALGRVQAELTATSVSLADQPVVVIPLPPLPLPPVTLAITVPAEGEQFAVGAPIRIQATAVSSLGGVYRLEFFAGKVRLGVSEIMTLVAVPPGEPLFHEFLWRDPPPGRHELRVASPTVGEFPAWWSAPVTVVVGEVKPAAQLVLVQPPDGAELMDPEVVELTAEATDPEGLLETVEFRANGELIGTSRVDFCPPCLEPPCPLRPCILPAPGTPLMHSFVWPRPAAGKYSLEARALRANGETVVSPAARLAVVRAQKAALALVAPAEGSTWGTPGQVPLEVSAVDPDGEIRRVEFLANGKAIGVSEILTKDVEIPGRPRTHRLSWTNPPAGTHQLQAQAVSDAGNAVASDLRTIVVIGNSETPVVWVEAADPVAVEGGVSEDGQKDVLRFRIHRLGDSPRDLYVYFHFEGHASPVPADRMSSVAMPARLPAKAPFVDVTYEPFDDGISEGNRSLVLTLDPSPTMGPVEPYRIDPTRGHAKGIIMEDEPVFAFELPEDGDWFPSGAPVPIRVQTTWSEGYVSHLEFFADGKKIGDSVVNFIQVPKPSTPVRHEFVWPDAPAGGHRLTVQTTLVDGSVVKSAEGRNIRVGQVVDALPVVTVQAGRPYAVEGDRFNRGEFILQRSGDLSREIAVNIGLSGKAVRGVDYRLLLNPCDDCAAPDQEIKGDSVVMPAGQATVTLGVLANFDGLLAVVEPVLEDVQLQVYTPPIPLIVGAKPPYLAGSPDQATVQVVDRKNPETAELILVEPEAGAVLPLGKPNVLRAIAVDPLGSIRRVEFVANDGLIGVSEITTEEVDIPGRLRLHTFLWTVTDAALAGPYTLTARAKNAAGSEIQAGLVPVTVGGTEPTLPVVTITPWQKTAFERGDWKSRGGGFTLTRKGGVNFAEPLTVFVQVGGTATASLDYQWSLPEDDAVGADGSESLPFVGPYIPVTFPAGAAAVDLLFTAASDDLVEGDETVRVEVIEPPIRSLGFPNLLPFPAYYLIGEPNAGEVVIQDANLDQPFIGLTQPAGGTRFHVGQIIPLVATAIHPEAGVEVIEFLADGQVIATVNYCCDVCDCLPAPKGQPFTARFDWKSATPGPHVLVARTFAGPNQVLESAPVTIIVGDAKPASLVIVTPPDGAVFPLGKVIPIDTVGQDPTSLVSTVEFFANGEKIGETCFLCVAKGFFPPGMPLHNQLQWTPSKPGKYVLTAVGQFGDDRKLTAPPVTVQIEGQIDGPRLAILQPLAGARVSANADVPVVAVGVGREGGITDVVLLVDGKPAGESHLAFFRPPGVNEEVRHEFTVRLEPGTHQLAVRDLADPAVISAPVTVVAGKAEAAITWVAPPEGAEFAAGKTIVLEVQAVDPTGLFFQVEFFDGDILIGTSEFSCPLCRLAQGATIPHRLEWHGAKPGKHVLTARAARTDGTVVSSIPRHITVTGDHPPGSFVTRVLPNAYEAGKEFKVQLEARPDASVAAYVIEEQPPYTLPAPGLPDQPTPLWRVVSISHDGVFDRLSGKIKFGPFFDHEPRNLSYQLVADIFVDTARFEGVGVADGTPSPIIGDSELRGNWRHPADRNPADDVLSAAELTAYAAAWKREQAWPEGQNPIPVAYVSRAAVLWRGGEHYTYYPPAGPPPFCWVNGASALPAGARSAAPAPLAGVAMRHEEPQADGSVRVTLRVTPAPGAQAFALEEHLPAAATVSGITGDGTFTPASRTLRWGPYFVGESPVLSYIRAGKAGGEGTKGIVSFDGQNIPIRRQEAKPDAQPDRLVGVDPLHDGSHQISLEADALQQGAEYELQIGTDLRHWTPVGVFSSGHDTGFVRDSGATNADVRFYRAVRVR